MKAERGRETSVDLRKLKNPSGTSSGSLLFLFEICGSIDLELLPSHLVLSFISFRHRNPRLAVPGPPSLWGQARRRGTRPYTRRGSCPFALGTARFLQSYPFLDSRLNYGRHPLGAFSAPAYSARPARRSCRRQPKVKACRSGQHTSFQAARVVWSHR